MVGAWSSDLPPGRIGTGKLRRMNSSPAFISTYMQVLYEYRMESEMTSKVTKGINFSPFRVLYSSL